MCEIGRHERARAHAIARARAIDASDIYTTTYLIDYRSRLKANSSLGLENIYGGWENIWGVGKYMTSGKIYEG